ncbi:MAG: DUF1043 family protein [Halofilum sp. (in: g-proteobacteria)]
MEAEYWVLSIIAMVLALVAGFIGGRMSAPRQRRVEAMEQERDAAREEAEAVRAEVNRHFEESARMFGKLASDYRTFFQQFAQTAQSLGLSEGRARELLEEADPSLVARQAGRPEREAPASGTDGARSGPAVDAASAAAAEAEDSTPTEASVDEHAGTDEATRSGDTPEPAAGGGAPGEDVRPEGGEGESMPPDYDSEGDRRG